MRLPPPSTWPSSPLQAAAHMPFLALPSTAACLTLPMLYANYKAVAPPDNLGPLFAFFGARANLNSTGFSNPLIPLRLDVNAADYDHRTPLHLASAMGQHETVWTTNILQMKIAAIYVLSSSLARTFSAEHPRMLRARSLDCLQLLLMKHQTPTISCFLMIDRCSFCWIKAQSASPIVLEVHV